MMVSYASRSKKSPEFFLLLSSNLLINSSSSSLFLKSRAIVQGFSLRYPKKNRRGWNPTIIVAKLRHNLFSYHLQVLFVCSKVQKLTAAPVKRAFKRSKIHSKLFCCSYIFIRDRFFQQHQRLSCQRRFCVGEQVSEILGEHNEIEPIC